MSISVTLTHLPDTLTSGEFLVPSVRVRNDGADPARVSGRLNLFEGDVTVHRVRGNDRTTLRGAATVDSFPRPVELDPGEALESGLFLAYTSEGMSFAAPDSYRLRAEYDPGNGRPMETSEAATLRVTEPGTDEARELAGLVDEPVARAIALCSLDADPSTVGPLETLAERFPERREGALASLALATIEEATAPPADQDALGRAFEHHSPTALARWISALVGPAAEAPSLVEAYLAYLDREGAAGPGVRTARRVVRGEPLTEE